MDLKACYGSINCTKAELEASSTFRTVCTMQQITHKQETRQPTLEKNGLFSFLGVKFHSLPRVALQMCCSLLSVRGTIQFHAFDTAWQKFLDIVVMLQFPVSSFLGEYLP